MKNTFSAAGSWRNPRFIANANAERLTQSQLLGARLRAKTAAGWALGTFMIELPAPRSLTTLALAGFDFVVLDLEHSAIDLTMLESLITAAHAAGIAALVRTCSDGGDIIGKVLDMGAHGIVAPHVESAERAREIVREARFPPHGARGFSPLTRFDALRKPLAALTESTFVVVQIEGRSALERVGEIAAEPGIDAVFVGPYDLALSLRVPPGSPEVFAAARRITRAVPQNVALGIYLDDPAACATWAARRFALQCLSFDGRMFSDAARAMAARARAGMRDRGGRTARRR